MTDNEEQEMKEFTEAALVACRAQAEAEAGRVQKAAAEGRARAAAAAKPPATPSQAQPLTDAEVADKDAIDAMWRSIPND
jgi:hypothetical protein